MSDTTRRRVAVAAGADVAAIIVFVALGRRTHDESNAITGALATATPFVVGTTIGWLVARAWRAPMAGRTGVVVWVTTIAVGMPMRRTVFDDGTAAAFVVVAMLFLGLFLVGWRLVARQVAGHA
jgi:hypothetical protein